MIKTNEKLEKNTKTLVKIKTKTLNMNNFKIK